MLTYPSDKSHGMTFKERVTAVLEVLDSFGIANIWLAMIRRKEGSNVVSGLTKEQSAVVNYQPVPFEFSLEHLLLPLKPGQTLDGPSRGKKRGQTSFPPPRPTQIQIHSPPPVCRHLSPSKSRPAATYLPHSPSQPTAFRVFCGYSIGF